MKYRKLIIAAILILAVSTACEKPAIEDNGDNKETTSGKGNGNSGGDHGGWSNDTGNGKDGADWQDGDTVNVSGFCNAEDGRVVWVKGYIVGCATGSGGYTYQLKPPFEYETAILLADKANETDFNKTVAVQLKSSSHIRTDLNLVTHKDYYGKQVLIYGEKTRYLKLPGMKTIFAYRMISG